MSASATRAGEQASVAAAALETETELEALRAQGAQRLDAVRFRHIEALQRRAARHQGEARRLMDARLGRLLAACRQAVAQAVPVAPNVGKPAPLRGPLAGLLADLAGNLVDADKPAQHAPAPAELKTVRYFRSTWSRLRVDQQMTQALAGVPEQAGPLNTPRLLHQALTLMRRASPEYTQRFMAQVEALLWLEQAGQNTPAARKGPGAPVARKTQTAAVARKAHARSAKPR